MMAAAPRLAAAELVWGLASNNRLVVFAPETPGTLLMDVPITGLQTGEIMRAMDFRPLDGQLYGYGSTHRLYRIHMLTGVATQVGSGTLALTVDFGAEMGFDFNPATDEIRVVTSSNQNFRISPTTGQVIDGQAGPGIQGDTPLNPAGAYVAVAYTNSYPGATTTTLFAIDAATDSLVRIGGVGGTPSPNLGEVTTIGPLGVTTNTGAALDAALLPDNQLYAHLSGGGFCRIERSTGDASCVGTIASGSGINDIAVLSIATQVYALTQDQHLLRLKNHAPAPVLGDVPITGLVEQATGEALDAIDVRPATARVYGISNRRRLYTIDPVTGTATVVGDPGAQMPFMVGNAFGMDFDPLTDQLRVISNDGFNRRVHPDTLAITEATILDEPGPTAIGYSNHISGAGTTTLYGVDANHQRLVTIGGLGGTPSPDTGAVFPGDPLPPGPDPFLGFDFSPADDNSLVGARISGADRLAYISPRAATVAPVGPIGNPNGPVIGITVAPPGIVQFSAGTSIVQENAGNATLTVVRVNSTVGPFSVNYQVAGGTADAADYTPVQGTLIFLDGETSKTILVPIDNDAAQEGPETIVLSLSHPTLGARLGTPQAATITIADDEAPPNTPPNVFITSPTADPATTVNGLLVTLAGGAVDDAGVASVTWSTDRGSSGTAQGTSNWLAPDIPLALGTTIITVTATDANGAQGTDTIAVTVSTVTYLLAEGATGAFFDLDILLANPHTTPAPITLTFLKENGSTVVQTLTLPATSRTTVHADTIPGLEGTAVSTIVSSNAGLPLVVERTMRWDAGGYGAHTEKAVDAPAFQWYFAEGSQGFFFTYVLLTNPDTAANTATILYLREGASPVSRTYNLAPLSRLTVDAGADPDLVNQSFGMIVNFDQPGVAERAMYFGASPLWKAGHESAGVTVPAQEWFLAEGATGPFFETFVLLSNPQTTSPADVTLTYLRAGGTPITTTKTIPPASRLTINVEGENPGLANAAFGTQVSSSVPIVVERAQYWPFAPDQWYEAHNSFGTLAAGTKWGLAEGRVGGPNNYQTYILLANPTSATADVTITFLRTNGTTVTKTFSVGASSRFNVAPGPGGQVPELSNEEFSAVIVSTQPIVVERAMYLDAGGLTWSAGTNATATRLP